MESITLSPEKKAFIDFMTDAGVLRFGEFKTKSGRLSPYFVNTGLYRTGKQIAALGKYYAALIHEKAGEFDAMFGPAYKGIPLVVTAAGALAQQYGEDKPFFFNRKEAKDHGEGGSLVGYQPQDGDKVIIIEDVITAGTALRETMPLLASCAKVKVEKMFISVDRCERGLTSQFSAVEEAERDFGIEVCSIVTVYDILRFLSEKPENAEHVEAMKRYIAEYCRPERV